MNFSSVITTLALLPWKKVQIFSVLTSARAKAYLDMQQFVAFLKILC